MNIKEYRMLELLKDLKENYGVLGVKAEFEAEGTRRDEITRLLEIIYRADSELVLKIGGCEAISDMEYSKILGATGIIAPMIESPFAMSKFVSSINKVFSQEERKNMKFIINVETKTCVDNLDDIFSDKYTGMVDCIVIGRVDLSASLGYSRKEINNEDIFNTCKKILEKCREKNICTGIGGGIAVEAIPFIKNLGSLIDKVESRKIIFSVKNCFDKLKVGLIKAMEFECLYLEIFQDMYTKNAVENSDRITMMQERIYKAALK